MLTHCAGLAGGPASHSSRRWTWLRRSWGGSGQVDPPSRVAWEPFVLSSATSPTTMSDSSEFLRCPDEGVAVGSRGLQQGVLGADEKRGGLLSGLSSWGREKAHLPVTVAAASGRWPHEPLVSERFRCQSDHEGGPAYYDGATFKGACSVPFRRGCWAAPARTGDRCYWNGVKKSSSTTVTCLMPRRYSLSSSTRRSPSIRSIGL